MTVLSVTDTAFTTNTTSHLVPMPETVEAGDLLLLAAANHCPASSITSQSTPSGWTLISQVPNPSNYINQAVYAKIADGTEGGTTVDVVTAAAETMSAHVYRVGDFTGSIADDIDFASITAFNTASGTVASPVTAGWGEGKNLYINFHGSSDDNIAVDTIGGSGYGNLTETRCAGGGDNSVNLASTYKIKSGIGSESDSTSTPWTFVSTEAHVDHVLVVRLVDPTPIVVSSSVYNSDSLNELSSDVPYPASIVEGNCLILSIMTSRTGAFTDPEGWTRLFTRVGPNFGVSLAVMAKTVDGTESGTVTVVSDADRTKAAIMVQVSGVGNPDSIEVEAAFVDTQIATLDPPSITHSGGEDDYLYLAWGSTRGLGPPPQWDPTTPAGYEEVNVTPPDNINQTNYASMVVARKPTLASTTEDPAAFTVVGGQAQLIGAWTMAIPPGTPSGGGGGGAGTDKSGSPRLGFGGAGMMR